MTAIQSGDAPARTMLELVDAVRQDIAGAGACASSLTYLMREWPEATAGPLRAWVERLTLHLERMEAKCALALTEPSTDA